jgi:aminoglycoside/choline kinase family phosphotransferase
MPASLTTLSNWVCQQLNTAEVELMPIVSGLSARHYYRVHHNAQVFIVGDASDERSELGAFVFLAQALCDAGVRTPMIYHVDLELGFFIEEDFGSVDLFSLLTIDNAKVWYDAAIKNIAIAQKELTPHPNPPPQAGEGTQYALPVFDVAWYRREWNIFLDGYLVNYYAVNIERYAAMLEKTFELLVNNNMSQPQVFVYRDYHSQNIMVLEDNTLGMLDFQSARLGALSYDLVSLLKDCYIEWEPELVDEWAIDMMRTLIKTSLSDRQLLTWFDLTGLQRHLKVLGQFARQIQQGKTSRIADLKRVERYVAHVCNRYEQLSEFNLLLKDFYQ